MEKQCITDSECMSVALVIQHARHIRAIFSCHTWPVWLYNIFSRYLIHWTISREKIIERNRCVSILSTSLSETFLKQEKSASYNKYIWVGLHVQYALFWSGCNETWTLEKILKYQLSWKSFKWEPTFWRGWAGITKLMVVFCNFANPS
jgi:hypothetical protein